MSKILLQLNRQMQWALVPLLLLVLSQQAWGQCNNSSQYPSTSIDLAATNSTGTSTSITTCNFSGEYSVLINAGAGNSYRFTSSIATDYFTIRSGSPSGPVVGSGTQPLTVTPGVSGNLYAHINSSSACLSDVSCRSTAVQCTSCAGGGCINSNVYPSLNISLNPTNTSGAVQQITSCQFNGEYYSVIDVIANKPYTFSSSVATDWITVRTGTFNGTILGQGAGAVTVTPSTTATLFIHNNSNSSCGTGTVCRVSSVQCANCICQNSSQFPSFAESLNPTNTSGNIQTITACNFATEYFALTNVLSPKNYTITSSIATDWLTVRIGSPGGTVLAQGQTPLTITTTSTSDLYVHVNTNSNCGTNSNCRITAVQCTNCSVPQPCITGPTSPTNGQTNICPSGTQTLSWPASPGATSYDVYFGTTNPPPFVGNTVATSYVATTPGAGAYFWQIRPVGLGGTASGCNVWSFTKQDNTALPAGWSTGNTGAGTGSAGYNPCVQSSTQYTVSSTGYVPSITGEGIQAAFQTLCGNTTITTRVAGLSGGGWAGIMMRESLASGSKMVALKTQLTNQAIREARISTNGIKNSQTIPVPQIAEWLRIQRVGNIFTFSVSPNGVNWSPAGTITFTMNNCLLVGLFAESINVNTTTTALFDNVTTSGGVAPLAGDTGSGIEEAAHQQPEFSVYPNPTTGVVTVDLSAFQTPQARLQVYNANGQVVQTLELNTLENATERLDLSNYQNGIYLIRLQAEGYNDAVKRVVLFNHSRP